MLSSEAPSSAAAAAADPTTPTRSLPSLPKLAALLGGAVDEEAENGPRATRRPASLNPDRRCPLREAPVRGAKELNKK